MKTLTRVMLALIAALATLLVLAPTQSASATMQFTTSQDAQYVAVLTSYGIYSGLGPSGLVAVGHVVAADVYYGVRSPGDEQVWVYLHTPLSVSQVQANVIVNAATHIYLGMPLPGGSSA